MHRFGDRLRTMEAVVRSGSHQLRPRPVRNGLRRRPEAGRFADDTFFGRVERRLGKVAGPIPRTEFQVPVLETLKGSLPGSIIVSQEGGTDRLCFKSGMGDDPHLMEPGESCLLFTRPWASRGWHSVLSGYGKHEFAGPGDADQFRDRFTEAIRNEIPFVLPGTR